MPNIMKYELFFLIFLHVLYPIFQPYTSVSISKLLHYLPPPPPSPLTDALWFKMREKWAKFFYSGILPSQPIKNDIHA